MVRSRKPSRESSDISPDERAAMVALAEVLRDIFVRQGSSLEAKPDHSSTLTGGGKLLLQ